MTEGDTGKTVTGSTALAWSAGDTLPSRSRHHLESSYVRSSWLVILVIKRMYEGDSPCFRCFPENHASARFWPTGNCAVRVTASADLTIEAEDLTTAPPNKLGAETAAEMIAAELAISRLKGLRRRAAAITEAEKAGTLVEPGWQARCRQYVHGLLTSALQTSSAADG